jgi:SAM-dependent methyltransferase
LEKLSVYLLDTNIWPERLLAQAQSEVVGQLLDAVTTDQLLMSDFTLHSIGVILGRLEEGAVFTQFVQDVLVDGGVVLIGLAPAAMQRVVAVMERYQLDFDDAYQEYADTNAYNALCERPCTLSLLPSVTGQSVLDAACGPGFYAAWCVQRGAIVRGFDSSPTMVALARSRLRGMASIEQGSLTAPLSFVPEASCDVVICALALDYVADLTRPLSEFRRVLRPTGVLVFSIEHPTVVYRRAGRQYFDTEPIEYQSERLGVLKMYRRPLEAYFGALRTTGFVVEDVQEAFPTAACKEQYPEVYAKLSAFPYFLSVRARCAGST